MAYDSRRQIVVMAGGSCDWGTVDDTWEFGPATSAPELPTITNPAGNSTFPVAWSMMTGTLTSTLQEDDSADFNAPEVRYAGADTQITVTDQTDGEWYYRVRTSTRAGDSSWSSMQDFEVSTMSWIFLPLVRRHD